MPLTVPNYSQKTPRGQGQTNPGSTDWHGESRLPGHTFLRKAKRGRAECNFNSLLTDVALGGHQNIDALVATENNL